MSCCVNNVSLSNHIHFYNVFMMSLVYFDMKGDLWNIEIS